MANMEPTEGGVSRISAYCFLLLSNTIFIIIPLYFLIISTFTITKCPGNQILPFWLILLAILIIVDRILFWKMLSNEVKFEKTCPQPDEMNQKRIWEKNRGKSNSRVLVYLKTNLRVVFFLAVIFGLIWSHELLFQDNLCKPICVFSLFGFCFIASICYLFSFLGTIYIYCVSLLSRMDQRAKRSLNRVL